MSRNGTFQVVGLSKIDNFGPMLLGSTEAAERTAEFEVESCHSREIWQLSSKVVGFAEPCKSSALWVSVSHPLSSARMDETCRIYRT